MNYSLLARVLGRPDLATLVERKRQEDEALAQLQQQRELPECGWAPQSPVFQRPSGVLVPATAQQAPPLTLGDLYMKLYALVPTTNQESATPASPSTSEERFVERVRRFYAR